MIPNPELAPVADDQSIARFVDQEWERLRRALYDDLPYEATIRGIEEAIEVRKQKIEAGVLSPNIDWTFDLDRAAFFHRFNLTWIDHHRRVRERYVDFWKSVTERNRTYLRDIALNGMKSMLLIHGGVAIGALGVLTQQPTTPQIVTTAKFALGFALIGIISLGLGQLIMVQRMMTLNARLEAKFADTLTWKKISAFARYFSRYGWPLKYSDGLIYGSIAWFGIYSIILFLMLIAA